MAIASRWDGQNHLFLTGTGREWVKNRDFLGFCHNFGHFANRQCDAANWKRGNANWNCDDSNWKDDDANWNHDDASCRRGHANWKDGNASCQRDVANRWDAVAGEPGVWLAVIRARLAGWAARPSGKVPRTNGSEEWIFAGGG